MYPAHPKTRHSRTECCSTWADGTRRTVKALGLSYSPSFCRQLSHIGRCIQSVPFLHHNLVIGLSVPAKRLLSRSPATARRSEGVTRKRVLVSVTSVIEITSGRWHMGTEEVSEATHSSGRLLTIPGELSPSIHASGVCPQSVGATNVDGVDVDVVLPIKSNLHRTDPQRRSDLGILQTPPAQPIGSWHPALQLKHQDSAIGDMVRVETWRSEARLVKLHHAGQIVQSGRDHATDSGEEFSGETQANPGWHVEDIKNHHEDLVREIGQVDFSMTRGGSLLLPRTLLTPMKIRHRCRKSQSVRSTAESRSLTQYVDMPRSQQMHRRMGSAVRRDWDGHLAGPCVCRSCSS